MTGEARRRSVGRPAVPVLSREIIADCALELAVEEGAGKLTMTSLARRLGVANSALYNHVDGKTDLVLLLQDAVMSQVETSKIEELTSAGPVCTTELRAALDQWGRSYRSIIAQYSSLIPLIATMPVSGAPATREVYEKVARGLVHAGTPKQQVVPVIVAFESFIFGSAIDVHAPAEIFQSGSNEDDAPVFRQVVNAFTANYAGRSGSASNDASGLNPYADAPFEWGLAALVDRVVHMIQ